MICPRCEDNLAEVFMKSPVGDFWELYKCNSCGFMWRSTEEEEVKDPNRYKNAFKIRMSTNDFQKKLPQVPPCIAKQVDD